MRTPLHRIRFGALVLITVFCFAVVGYRVLGGYSWVDSVWMVVITISSVGYAESSQATTPVKLLTMVVILVGMSAAVYTVGGFMQLVLEGEFERTLGRRRMTRGIENLRQHVIICGFGRIGEALGRDLRYAEYPLMIIDNDLNRIELAKEEKHLCVLGDATEEEVLRLAGIEYATTLFTGLPSDADNVFITLTARNLSPEIQIVARGQHHSTAKKLRQAGANRVVMPTIIGAQHVQRIITRPSTADLMELVAESSFDELDLDEVLVVESSKLVGVSVQKTEAHRRHRLLVVAVRQADNSLVFNPDASYTFQPYDILMVLGHREDIVRFREEFEP